LEKRSSDQPPDAGTNKNQVLERSENLLFESLWPGVEESPVNLSAHVVHICRDAREVLVSLTCSAMRSPLAIKAGTAARTV
jgi:hypothetical protein